MLRWLPVWLGIFAAGCSGDPATPLEGVVTLDGQPLPRVTVMLVPEADDSKPAQGMSNADGVCQLVNGDGRALPAGRYKVVVVAAPVPNSRRVPAAYGDPRTSPLTVEVSSSYRRIELPLQSK